MSLCLLSGDWLMRPWCRSSRKARLRRRRNFVRASCVLHQFLRCLAGFLRWRLFARPSHHHSTGSPMFYLRYILSELRRRKGRTFLAVRIPRVKTDAAERVVPMVPTLHEILLGDLIERGARMRRRLSRRVMEHARILTTCARGSYPVSGTGRTNSLMSAATGRSVTSRHTLCEERSPRCSQRSVCRRGGRCT
jgi:hypothetical protein